MVSTAKTIGEDLISEYEAAGAICLRGFFDEHWVERLRAAVQRRSESGPQALSRRQAAFSFTELFMARSDPEFREFVLESPAAAIAAQLMRSRSVRFYFDQIFNKEPGHLEISPWHNDQPFYPISGEQVCSVWVALDRVTKESSGLQYISGSHRWEKRPEGDLPDIEQVAARSTLLCWDMEPGDCLVHSGFTVHGASGNMSSDNRRRALATRWIGDDVVYRVCEKARAELQVPGLLTGDPLPAGEPFPEVAHAQEALNPAAA